VIPAVADLSRRVPALAFVDDWCGIVRQLLVHEIGPSDPPLFFATAQLGSTRGFSDVEAGRLNGGAGLTVTTALQGALGEAIERYSIGLYRESELVRGSYAELAADALDPRRLIFFADDQYDWPGFPYARFDAGRTLSWVVGESLLDGRARLVPACRVFTPYLAPSPGELVMQSTSTGAACHTNRDRAVVSALLECIERDAFTMTWLNRLPLPGLSPGDVGETRLTAAVRALACRGIEVRLLDATSDLGWPTVVCVLAGPTRETPALAFGAATHGNVREAAHKAFVESAHTWFWIRTRTIARPLPVFRDDFADVTSLEHHSLLYADHRVRRHATFLWSHVPDGARAIKERGRQVHPERLGSPRAQLERCVGSLRAAGMDAVVIDVTPADVRDAGFVVVRVVVTDLHPLWGGHQLRCLGGARLQRFPVALGYRNSECDVRELNAAPHPMP
jgi:ribosomal protein S12 methylthiotransferase accessory factor